MIGGEVNRAQAQATIDPAYAYAWGANIGWTNWRPNPAQGVSIGEYVCSGYVYGANVGWINLGSGAPVNGIQYANNSATDFGVNYLPTSAPGVATLRGYAYGANIGWIAFENTGNPSVNLVNGQLYGYAYSASCGWINLGSMTTQAVRTLTIARGVDTDGDGIADAWELQHFGNLTTANATSDFDGDGQSDLREYLDGTDPMLPGDSLRVTQLDETISGGTLMLALTFATTTARLYEIEGTHDLVNPSWTDAGLGTFSPDGGTQTTRQISVSTTDVNAPRFFRIRALSLGF